MKRLTQRLKSRQAGRYSGRLFWETLENRICLSAVQFVERDIIEGETSRPESVYAADLDGDGDMDLLSASGADDKIAWYENTDGLGDFGPQRVITREAKFAKSVVAADVDGDGDIDVLSASSADQRIAWYENLDGRGTFGTQHLITTRVSFPEAVYAADLDGDGDIDVLSASRSDDKIAWYENIDGKGNFGPQSVIDGEANGAISVIAKDVDSDGDIDVLAASVLDGVSWYENVNGMGVFGSKTTVSTGVRPESVSVADVDDDGDLDIVSPLGSNRRIVWYENEDGKGAFGTEQIVAELPGRAKDVYLSDVDGDGDIDVLSAEGLNNNSQIAWYENTDGKGTFETKQTISAQVSVPQSVHAADVDGDGDVDVVSALLGDDSTAWYENVDGTGTFGPQHVVTPRNPRVDAAISVQSADLDGDGDIDVLAASSQFEERNNDLTWYENIDGLGTFGDQQVIGSLLGSARAVFAVDLDGDDDMDVLSFASGGIAWFKNLDGAGTFDQASIFETDIQISSVFPTDVDGDGDLDVLFASVRPNTTIWWSENVDGRGTFGARRFVSGGSAIALLQGIVVHATDIDGDGDQDVVMGNRSDDAAPSDDTLAWYQNDEGGPWIETIIDGKADHVVSVQSVDLDADGDPDILTASTRGDTIAWYENTDGRGSFGPRNRIIAFGSALSVFSADMDNDGDEDALAAMWSSGTVAWYDNTDGRGTFERQAFGPNNKISARATGVSSVHAADIDGDGDFDVLSASLDSDKIAWYENGLVDTAARITLTLDKTAIAEAAGVATVTATLSQTHTQPVTVDLGLTGTATGGSDYVASGTQIVIGLGDTSGSVTITATDDTLGEPNETVIVTSTNITNGQGGGSVTVTITDDDEPPVPDVTLVVDNAEIAEAGGTATFTATLSEATTVDVTVNLAISGTATASDFTAPATQVVIGPGSTSGSITVTAVDDTEKEPDETVIVDIASVTGGNEDGVQQQTTTIVDDDLQSSLIVTSLDATSTGFRAEFNNALDFTELNLYDNETAAMGRADVVLVGDSTGQVIGSLVQDSASSAVTFIKTGGPLAQDTYTVTLRSAEDGFKSTSGQLLDGNGDGIAGDGFSDSFTVMTLDNAITVGPLDFVRGRGQKVHLPASTTTGIPLSLSESDGVRAVDLQISYDAALLNVSTAVVGPGMPSGASVVLNNLTPGLAILSFFSPVALPAGPNTLVNLVATVPATDASEVYGQNQILNVHSVTIRNGNNDVLPVVIDDALHLAAYFGDVSGNGRINASDAAQVARFAALIDNGFSASLVTDPIVVGDISGNGRVNAADASRVARFAALIEVPEIPPIPGGIRITGGDVALGPVVPGAPTLLLPPSPVTDHEQNDRSGDVAPLGTPMPTPHPAVDYVMCQIG